MELGEILEVCKNLAKTAGQKILAIYESQDLDIRYKEDHSPLTKADRASNKIIVSALKDKYPDYAILSEEEKDDKSRLDKDWCFVIDPLDGTKEFIKRNGEFTVNIALTYKHQAILGVIYVPVTRELYYAAKGLGCFLDSPKEEGKRLFVSNLTGSNQIRLVMSSSHGSPRLGAMIEKYQITHFKKMGSSIKGCLIARGDAEVYYRDTPTMEWDTCAMQVIVEEAGGIFRQGDGSKMIYNRKDSLNSKGFYILNTMENMFEF